MNTSDIPTMIDHLVTLFKAASGLSGVEIVDGPMPSSGPLPLALWVGVDDIVAAAQGETTAADSTAERSDFATGQREDLNVYCVAGAYDGSVDAGFSPLRAAVAGITAAVQTAVNGDVQTPWQNPGVTGLTWRQVGYNDGLQVFVPFRITYIAL